MIKFVVANTMNRVVDRALQVHGGLGMTDDTILAFFYRHERAARIYDGADEVHKTNLAKRILRSRTA
jgi:alkylation response protein AidB-like acyl-CoA dehydrogenase